MYTVKELIEALKQCPEDYTVTVFTTRERAELEAVGIDHEEKTVDLFGNY